jgi:hypothetical protein
MTHETEQEQLMLDESLARRLDPDQRDIEAPTADAAEQATAANPADEVSSQLRPRVFEVSEYDALEQERVVELDDDYR